MTHPLPSLVDPTPGHRIWRGEGWEMREGRWEESPPEVVDHVVSDPPFSAQQSANAKQRVGLATRTAAGRKRLRRLGVTLDVAGCAGLSFNGIDPATIGPPLAAIARRWIVLFCAIEQTGDYKRACREAYLRGGWWDKTNATPQFTGDRPGMPGEAIIAMHRPRGRRWNGGGKVLRYVGPSSHATGAEEGVTGRVHETQKPLWLMRALISDFTDPGELIWDPYAGSATTGVACLQLGRRFLGHEMQAHYAEVAAERLTAAERGQKLSEYRAGQGVLFGGEAMSIRQAAGPGETP